MVTVLGKPVLTPHSHNANVSKLIQLFHLNPIFDMDTQMQAPGRSYSVSVLFVQLSQ